MGKKLTKEEIYDRILEKYKDHENIDCSKVEVINMSTPVTLICKLHGEFTKRPLDILYKRKNCPICSKIEKTKKIKETKLIKYGDENYNNSQKTANTLKAKSKEEKEKIENKRKLTKLKRYNTATYNNREKAKETCLEKYGVENPYQSEEIKDKIKHNNLEKYGVEYYTQTNECKEKVKSTNLKKYGVECNLNLDSIKNKANKSKNSRSSRLKAKATMIKHGNNSSLENLLEKELIDLKINYKKEYNDRRYPYHCDFYIPKLDMFIEINAFWVHGYHWFNKNDPKDIETLNTWKEKSKTSKFYEYAIRVWIIKDLEKRKTAEQNNLNYVVLWNRNDIIQFIENLKGYNI